MEYTHDNTHKEQNNIIYMRLEKPTKQQKHNLKTFCLINTGYALTKKQRKERARDISEDRKEELYNVEGCEYLDNEHYYNEDNLSRFYVDYDFNKLIEAPETLNELLTNIDEPFKKIFGDDYIVCMSGYSNNKNYLKQLMKDKNEIKHKYLIQYKKDTKKILSLHLIVLNKFMSGDDLIQAGNLLKELLKNSKFKIDNSVYKKDKSKDQLFRVTIFKKADKNGTVDNNINFDDSKFERATLKSILFNTAVCYFTKCEDIQQYQLPKREDIKQTIIPQQVNTQVTINNDYQRSNQEENNKLLNDNLEISQQETINEDILINPPKDDDELLKNIAKERDTKLFNEKYSIFEFCNPEGSLSMKRLLYSLSDNDELPITEKLYLKELKIWFDKTEHTTYKTFEEFLKFPDVKPNLKALEVDKMYLKLNSLAKQTILNELLPALDLIKHLKYLQNKIKKDKNPTKEDKKRLILKFNSFVDKSTIQPENEPDFDNSSIAELITSIYEFINTDNVQLFLKPLSQKRAILDLYENKLNTIKDKFLKSRFIHFSEFSELPQLQIAYIEDISKFYYKDKTIAEDTLKRKKIDTNQDFPMFDNVLSLQQKKYKYKGKISTNKLDIEKWMNVFKDSFASHDMFVWYMSWFHHKFNNKLINKNILNIGDKNCLKTSFIEYFSLMFDIRKATARQVIGQFNGTIIEGKIVFIDEIQDLSEKDKTDFIQFVKNNTSTDIVSGEKKFENVETNKEKTFDMIMNTNIWSLPNELFSSSEADKMLKRIKIIERKELPIETLKDTDKFPDIQKDVGYKYQLYKFIKNWEFKDIKPISETDMRLDETPTKFEQMYKDINTQETPKLDSFDFYSELKQNKIIKPPKEDSKDKRYIFTFTDFKHYFATHRQEQIEVNIGVKKGKENLMVYLNKYKIKFDSKSRFDSKEDVDKFIEHFTEYKTYEEIMNYGKTVEEQNKVEEPNI